MDLLSCRDFCVSLAGEAGAIIKKSFRSADTRVSLKSASDLVTNIDRETEALLFNRVKSKYPDHGIIAEEGSRTDGAGEFVWYIDPLDGTNNYAHGIPMCCVSIAVYSVGAGEIVVGVVYDPLHDELFSAVRGKGAVLNGREISVSKTDTLEYAMIATGFPYDKKSAGNNVTEFSRVLPLIRGIRRMGSAAIDLCYVAAGRFDGYWEGKIKPWDMAAGALIVREAGGKVSKYDGSGFEPKFPQILATNGLIHEPMIEVLTGS